MYLLRLLTLMLASAYSLAEIACGDLYWPDQSDVQKIEYSHPLDDRLFTINPYSLRNSNLKTELIDDFGDDVTEYGLFQRKEICLKNGEDYNVLAQTEFGQMYLLTHSVSSCSNCITSSSDDLPLYVAGIELGQSKKEVSKLLGVDIEKDTVRLDYRYISESEDSIYYHNEYLLINFIDGFLVFLLAGNITEI